MDMRDELLAQKQRLEQALDRKRKARQAGMVEMVDELSLYDQHPADVASELYEREKDAGLEENLELQLTEVNHALEQMQDGNYGYCEKCGDAIGARRLQALPHAVLCVDCAEKEQDKFTRPEEERQTNMGDITEKGEWFKVAEHDFFEEWHKQFPE